MILAYHQIKLKKYSNILSKINSDHYADSAYISLALESITHIYALKPTEGLQELILIEKSKGVHSYSDVLNARTALNIDSHTTDYEIMNKFDFVYPTKAEKESITVISEFRDSAVLIQYNQSRLPIGLTNIGNTYAFLFNLVLI